MATITASLFTALDGVVDPGVGDWHFPYFNEEMGEAVGETHDADVMLCGRVTYDSVAGVLALRPSAREAVVGPPSEQHHVGVVRLRDGGAHLVVEVREVPVADHGVDTEIGRAHV